MKSPLDQFDIISIVPIFIGYKEMTVTNLTVTLFALILIGVSIFYMLYEDRIVPRNYQITLESIFIFIYRLVYEQIGKSGLIYFPFIFSLFTFILILNFISLLPFGFAVTSHIIWTVYFSLSICLGVFILGILKHKIYFFKLFVPEVPLFLYPMMIILEIFSYIIRSFSLAIRLSANILAGHTLVHIIASFVSYLCSVKTFLVIIPLLLLFAIFVLEFGVAFLQAYIFVTLTSIYINEALLLGGH